MSDVSDEDRDEARASFDSLGVGWPNVDESPDALTKQIAERAATQLFVDSKRITISTATWTGVAGAAYEIGFDQGWRHAAFKAGYGTDRQPAAPNRATVEAVVKLFLSKLEPFGKRVSAKNFAQLVGAIQRGGFAHGQVAYSRFSKVVTDAYSRHEKGAQP